MLSFIAFILQALQLLIFADVILSWVMPDRDSFPRSLTSQIAGANNVAFAKADMVLDAVAIPGEIDSALTRLETMARERGVAVGIATALPVSIDRISQWAKAADARGIVLVPISVVANKPKPS